MSKIAVIGGGAAGFFAAIHAARPGNEVILLEKTRKVLAKVKVSGGGRCNVTNSCTDPALLASFYPRGNKELLGPFTVFGSKQTIEWFESRDVELKTEPDGRMFPVSNESQTIIDCLMQEAGKLHVKLMMESGVSKIKFEKDTFILSFENNASITADKVIVANGGSPSLKNYEWLAETGHTIIPPVPSLFTFNMPSGKFNDLMGLSVSDVKIKIAGTSFQYTGPLLFTHWGISGPVVLKLSAWAARWLAAKQYDFNVHINFFPDQSENEIREMLQKEMATHANKKVRTQPFKNIPSRLWDRLCFLSAIDEQQKWNETGKKNVNRLVQNLTCLELHVKGKTTFKEEFVTCGGVSLKNVNMKTMESKLVPGLFFAGEILDIDGVTGGFNFQAAWTTGFIAGNAV